MDGHLLPLPPGEGRGEGVLPPGPFHADAAPMLSLESAALARPLTPALSRRERGKAALVLPLLLLLSAPAHAISDPNEMLPNPAQEARAEAVGRQLRCLVCQNESIEDSNAALAKDLRRLVRGRIAAGDGDDQATAWVVARYGDFVRLRPPVTAVTAVLWASPILAVLAGLSFALMARRRAPAPAAPLSEAERRRLDALTGS